MQGVRDGAALRRTPSPVDSGGGCCVTVGGSDASAANECSTEGDSDAGDVDSEEVDAEPIEVPAGPVVVLSGRELQHPRGREPTDVELGPVHLAPDPASGYSVLCGDHSFLTDGQRSSWGVADSDAATMSLRRRWPSPCVRCRLVRVGR